MKRTAVSVAECANDVVRGLSSGILLTSKAGDKVNTMTIGWGHIGRIWNKPVFVAYVRMSRFTRELLDQNLEFTVNVPTATRNKEALALCGTLSGRDVNKIEQAGLTLVEPELISVPGIREFPLTLECRVIYRQEQDLAFLDDEDRQRFYSAEPQDHVAYYGQILASYVIEDE